MTTGSTLRKHLATPGGRRIAAMLLVSFSVALVPLLPVFAQQPPAPTFFWPYGKVQVAGTNLTPAVQPVIAFVNGRACGDDMTLVATAAPGTPAGDVGKTVYTINVLADGSGSGERAGCGHAGDSVLLYFPLTGMAVQQPAFHQGPQRADVDIVQTMSYRLQAPMMAADGTN